MKRYLGWLLVLTCGGLLQQRRWLKLHGESRTTGSRRRGQSAP